MKERSKNNKSGSERRRRALVAGHAIHAIKARHASDRSRMTVFAEQLTRIAGTTTFLLAHAIWFVVWVAWNVGLFGAPAFDPFPFGLLTMIVSLEAIFLSIFVLMSQSREAAIAELREEIALQVNLRTEEEVTKTLQLMAGLYARLGHKVADDPELDEMLTPLDAEMIEQTLAQQIEDAEKLQWVKKLLGNHAKREKPA